MKEKSARKLAEEILNKNSISGHLKVLADIRKGLKKDPKGTAMKKTRGSSKKKRKSKSDVSTKRKTDK